MGFFGDTFKAIKATNEALGKGAELLNEGASRMERASHRLRIESSIKLLEKRRKIAGQQWFSDHQEENEELNELYAELLREHPHSSISGKYFTQRDKLQEDHRDYKVQLLLNKIKLQNKRIIENESSSIAITKIEMRRRLIKLLTQLEDLGCPRRHDRYLVRANARKAELRDEIDDLEPQRKTVVSSSTLSVASKVEYHCFDDKKHGIYKDWFENGSLRWFINFEDDVLINTAQRFNDDGSLYMEVTAKAFEYHYEISHSNDQLGLNAFKDKGGFTLFVSHRNKRFVKILFKLDECPSKTMIALRHMMSLSGAISLLTPSERPIRFDEIQQIIQEINEVSSELRAIEQL